MSSGKEQTGNPEDHDHRERRCPRLGGPVHFQYCRLFASEDPPCFKILDCWWEDFDVTGFLKQTLPEPVFQKLSGKRPKPKVLSLLELIEQARKNVSADK